MAITFTRQAVTTGTGSTSLINNNFIRIQTALANALSRTGETPNSMSAQLDMNSNRIINLPTAVSNTEPVTLGQLTSSTATGLTFQGFVAERVTASSTGQTLVTLTNYTYDTAIDSLWVYVNGVYQAPNQYSKTSTSSITMGFSLQAGDVVDVLIFALESSADLVPSNLIVYARTAAEITAGVTPTNYFYPASPAADPRRYGGSADGSTDNTTNIQNALNSFPTSSDGIGGTIIVPKNYRFNLSTLIFPRRSNIIYYGGDDISDGTVVATNELRTFSANANSYGIVNEERFEAGFHPGLMLNVRKAITGHTSYLGVGQTQLNPVRASFNILDDNIERFRLMHEVGTTYSALYGFRMHAWVRRVVITGINSGSFGSVPTVGTLITGFTSGAKGFLRSIDGSGLVLEWFSGTFVVGEKLTDDNETTVATIATVSQASVEGHSLFSSYSRGYWGVAVRPNEQTVPFSVGGPIAIGPTQDLGQYIETTHTNTILKFQDAFAGTPSGRELVLDNAITAANRRITYRTLGGSSNKGMVGAVAASVVFADGANPAISTSAYNIASIVRTSTGVYTVTFTTALARADFGVQVSGNTFADFIRYGAKTTSTIRVESFNSAGTPTNLVGEVSLTVFCGDI